MANQWLRLWIDLPNDPKFRTIARLSGQPISCVIAIYIHMLCKAANADERGRTQGWCDEDIATALDIETDQVLSVRNAMQGRLLEGDYLTGWEKRQPLREDGAAERARAWRQAKKEIKFEDIRTQPNATEQNQTPDKIRIDKIRIDKSKQHKNIKNARELQINFYDVPEQIVQDFCAHRKNKKASVTQTAVDGIKREAEKAGISLADALMHCCSRDWIGFKASWVMKDEPRARGSPVQSQKEKTQAWVDKLLGKNEQPPDIIDIN